MTVCKEYEARISALIDDELTDADRLEVMEHLAVCPACKAFWEDLLAMRDALREEVPAPAGFADAVMSRVRETAQEAAAAEKKTVRFPGWKRFAGLAACCAVVALGVWLADSMQPESMTMSSARNSYAAPEMAGADDCVPGNEADLDVADDAGPYGYSAPCDVPESAEDKTAEEPAVCRAAITTSGDVAAQWVRDELGEEWASGACYSLSEEQFRELRNLLRESGEKFNEIQGDENGSGYLLLAE